MIPIELSVVKRLSDGIIIRKPNLKQYNLLSKVTMPFGNGNTQKWFLIHLIF